MIKNFRHKGLEKFFIKGSISGIQPEHADRIRLVLARLNVAASPADMNLPGLFLHRLKGKAGKRWSTRISGNWRITFEFQGEDVIDINYEDYH